MAKKITYEKQTVDLYDRMADALESISDNYGGATLPEVTNDDNGDVLAVVSGAWAKSAAPSSLPAVTRDDNGDVLTVVEGAWAKAAPSGGGGGVLTVNVTVDETAQDLTWVCDKTASEIYTAVFAMFKLPSDNSGAYNIGVMMNANESDGDYDFTVSCLPSANPDGDDTLYFEVSGANTYPSIVFDGGGLS